MGMLETALQIAAKAHNGQNDKHGEPYILHPLRVMAMVDGVETKCAALLHDVLEDTPVTAGDLEFAGIPHRVIAAVRLLTREEGLTYTDFIVRCFGDQIAKHVKLADLTDNSRIERAIMRPGSMRYDRFRLAKYAIAYKFLAGEVSEDDYRAAMNEI